MKIHDAAAKKIGTNLKREREAKGLTQATLATKIGASRQYVYMLEDGDRTPSLTMLSKIAGALGTTMEALIR